MGLSAGVRDGLSRTGISVPRLGPGPGEPTTPLRIGSGFARLCAPAAGPVAGPKPGIRPETFRRAAGLETLA